jgi:chemotaxis-related protein WspB
MSRLVFFPDQSGYVLSSSYFGMTSRAMLLLIFHLGDEMYAIDSAEVVEIIPLVNSRPLYHAPEYVTGIFNYRGSFVPLIDLCRLIQGKSCHLCLSTRIIIVNYPLDRERTRYLGLIAEKVTDTFYRDRLESTDLPLTDNKTTYLGTMIMDRQRMIQSIRLESLFADGVPRWLLTDREE